MTTFRHHAEKYDGLIREVTEHGIPDEAELIYSGRNRVYTLPAPDGTVINIKAFHNPRFPNDIIYTTLRQSKAKRSFEYATRLLAMGILTPEPIGWGEVRCGFSLKQSYYFCRQLPLNHVRDWEKIPDYEAMLRALGRDMVKFFDNGVLHKDFTAGNILYEPLADGDFRFYYIDLNRMDFGVTSHEKLMTMFRGIHPDKEQVAKLARYYAVAAGLDPEKTAREAVRQVDILHATKHRHAFFKKIFGIK